LQILNIIDEPLISGAVVVAAVEIVDVKVVAVAASNFSNVVIGFVAVIARVDFVVNFVAAEIVVDNDGAVVNVDAADFDSIAVDVDVDEVVFFCSKIDITL